MTDLIYCRQCRTVAKPAIVKQLKNGKKCAKCNSTNHRPAQPHELEQVVIVKPIRTWSHINRRLRLANHRINTIQKERLVFD